MESSTTSALVALSNDIAGTIERASGAVVAVEGGGRFSTSGFSIDDQHIITSDHAIDDDDETVEIVHADGKTEQATVVGHDGSTDLALLRSERAASVVLAHAPNDDLRVGALALALARDDDGDLAATMGVISALGAAWRTWRGGEFDRFIRPDVAISPRFSGGPLIDVHGRIVGMNTWGLSRRNAPTVPASTIARVVESLASGKRVSRGYLGIAMQSLELPQALAEIAKVAVGGGVIALGVENSGPAHNGGVIVGDIIVSLDGKRVNDGDDITSFLGTASVGKERAVNIIRGGGAHALRITAGERPHHDR